jgi:DNA-damage-inducible protein D
MADKIVKAGDHVSPFERIKRTNDAGAEFWSSREFAGVLGYGDYRNFEAVIEKAKLACFNSGHRLDDHFVDVTEMVTVGSGAQRPIKTILLSRYASYLVIQNADPGKEIVAQGQTYFAIQTRRQELADESIEDERRLILRDEIRRHNVKLADAAKGAGVIEPIDYAIFQNHGYMGLYGGLKQEDIHRRKGLKKSQKILDHMGSTELAVKPSANWAAPCARNCPSLTAPRSSIFGSANSLARGIAKKERRVDADEDFHSDKGNMENSFPGREGLDPLWGYLRGLLHCNFRHL